MHPIVVLAGATLGVALLLSALSLLRYLNEGDERGLLEATVTFLAGTMAFTAAAVIVLDGHARQLALTARAVESMLIIVPLLHVLGFAADETPPRWMTRVATVAAAAVAALTLTTDLYVARTLDTLGEPIYGPLYVPASAALGGLLLLWVVHIVRRAEAPLDGAMVAGTVAVPIVLIVGDLLFDYGPHELIWALALPPAILGVEAVRRRSVRSQRHERAVSARERERLLHELAVTNDELQTALRSRHELLDAASHELRTPLTALIGFAQTLRSQENLLDEARRVDIIQRLGDNAQRLRGVIDGMLAAQALRTNTLPPLPDDVLIHPLLVAATTFFSRLDANVTITCAPDITVWADPLHVPRIITSVVANASEHGMPPVEIAAERLGDIVRIVVIDNGPGIPDTFAPRLFEPFERASSGLSRTPGGIGLGLANAAGLAASCGGTLVHVPTARGARFEIELPASQSAAERLGVTLPLDAP